MYVDELLTSERITQRCPERNCGIIRERVREVREDIDRWWWCMVEVVFGASHEVAEVKTDGTEWFLYIRKVFIEDVCYRSKHCLETTITIITFPIFSILLLIVY